MSGMPHRLLTRVGLPEYAVKPLCVVGSVVSPPLLATGGGIAAIEAAPWAHPYAVYVLVSAVIQLFIALLRAWFGERREVIETLTRQIDRQEARFVKRLEEDAIIRHEQANQLQAQNYLIFCFQKGIDPVNPPKPLYDVEKEREHLRLMESGEIHMSRSASVGS
jgi:hypothetical protein